MTIYYILLSSLLIQIKLYRSIDIYYLKLLQHLVGTVVKSFLKNILPWPGVPLLLLGGKFLAEPRAEPQQSFVQACRCVDVPTCRRLYGRSIIETFVETIVWAFIRAFRLSSGFQVVLLQPIYLTLYYMILLMSL